MDPQACWTELDEAHYHGDWPKVREHAEALLQWLKSGGTPPQIPELSEMPPMVDVKKVVKALCVDLLKEARGHDLR